MKRWYGKLLGLIAGWLLFRAIPARCAVSAWCSGHAFDAGLAASCVASKPYRVLGLASDASDAEIDQAYRRLISQYHPDQLAGARRRSARARPNERAARSTPPTTASGSCARADKAA